MDRKVPVSSPLNSPSVQKVYRWARVTLQEVQDEAREWNDIGETRCARVWAPEGRGGGTEGAPTSEIIRGLEH